MRSMHNRIRLPRLAARVGLLLALSVSSLQSQVVAAQWNSMSSGSLNGVGFRASFCCAVGAQTPWQVLTSNAFLGPSYGANPLAAALVPQYGSNQTIDIQFDAPIDNLLLYAGMWRGSYVFPGPEPATTYSFSQSFTVQSGFFGITPVGNSLTLPGSTATAISFYNGVLAFDTPVSRLVVRSDFGGSGQVMTLASSTVPEPSAYLLMAAGLLAVLVWRRRSIDATT